MVTWTFQISRLNKTIKARSSRKEVIEGIPARNEILDL
jgi:hypothetical protein